MPFINILLEDNERLERRIAELDYHIRSDDERYVNVDHIQVIAKSVEKEEVRASMQLFVTLANGKPVLILEVDEPSMDKGTKIAELCNEIDGGFQPVHMRIELVDIFLSTDVDHTITEFTLLLLASFLHSSFQLVYIKKNLIKSKFVRSLQEFLSRKFFFIVLLCIRKKNTFFG